MAPRAPLLAAVLLLAASTAGCVVLNDVERFLGRLRGEPQLAELERLNEEVAFALDDPPQPGVPPVVGTSASYNFTVGEGATALRVDVSVAFEALEAPAAVPGLPGGVPRGQVNVTITPPGAAPSVVGFRETSAQTFDWQGPASGMWGVAVQAVGQGRVRVIAVSTEPAP